MIRCVDTARSPYRFSVPSLFEFWREYWGIGLDNLGNTKHQRHIHPDYSRSTHREVKHRKLCPDVPFCFPVETVVILHMLGVTENVVACQGATCLLSVAMHPRAAARSHWREASHTINLSCPHDLMLKPPRLSLLAVYPGFQRVYISVVPTHLRRKLGSIDVCRNLRCHDSHGDALGEQ